MPAKLRTEKILCIEDEVDLRDDIVEELEAAGYQTIEASNGMEGFGALRAHRPDLVLCDISMPVMDGHQFLTKVRTDCPEFGDVPFIFLSALSSREQIIGGKALGADDYLVKPIDFQLMTATIEARLEQIRRIKNLHSKEVGSQNNRDTNEIKHSALTLENRSQEEIDLGSLVGKDGANLAAGRLQMIGLENVKEQLGDHWLDVSERIYKIAENIIRYHLSNKDILSRDSSNQFIICFGQLSEKEACFKAQAIEDEIGAHILGSTYLEQIRSKTNLNLDPANLARMKSEVHSIEVTPDDVTQTNLFTTIGRKLASLVDVKTKKIERMMAQLGQRAELRTRRVLLSNGVTAPLEFAALDARSDTKLRELHDLSRKDPKIIADTDILILLNSAGFILKKMQKSKSKLIVPLNFSTIDNKIYSEKYLSSCAELESELYHHIVFMIRDLPKNLDSERIIANIGPLRQYARLIILDLPEPSITGLEPDKTKVLVFSIDYAATQLEGAVGSLKVRNLAKKLAPFNAKLIVDQVPASEARTVFDTWSADLVATR